MVRVNVPPVGLPETHERFERSRRPRSDNGTGRPLRLGVAVDPDRIRDRRQRRLERDGPVLRAGSNPGTRDVQIGGLGYVEAGMSKKILSGFITPPTTSALAFRMACRSDPAPESLQFVTTYVESNCRDSSHSRQGLRRERFTSSLDRRRSGRRRVIVLMGPTSLLRDMTVPVLMHRPVQSPGVFYEQHRTAWGE